MKTTAVIPSLLLACAALAASAEASFSPQSTAIPGSVPQGINYQGRLEDDAVPVTGSKQMVFRIYDALASGNLLWTSPAQTVSVSMGLFNAPVPVPVSTLVGGGARYMEVQIDGTTMSPRELLSSVPYALIAKSVEGTIDVSTAGLAINAGPSASQPSLSISSQTGNVGIGTGSPASSLDVGGNAQFGAGAAKSTFTASGALALASNAGLTLSGASGGIASQSSVTASAFFGDGSRLTGIPSTGSISGFYVAKAGDGMSGPLTLLSGSTLTIAGNAFSVGGSTLAVKNGGVGIGTASPAAGLDVNGSAQFGAGAAKSTFTASGALALASNAGLTLSGASGSIASQSSVTASAFFGDGSNLAGIPSTGSISGFYVAKAGDAMTGPLTLSGSTMTVTGDAFSVGGSTFVVAAGRIGIGTTAPGGMLDITGTYLRLLAGDIGGTSAGNLYLGTGGATRDTTRFAKVENNDAGASAGAAFWASALGAMIQAKAIGSGVSALGGYGILQSNSTNGLSIFDGSTTSKIDFHTNNSGVSKMRIDSTGNVGIGTGNGTPADRMEVAGGNVRLTAVAGSAGSVKLFSALTAGAVACAAQCGANTTCLAAWTSAGVASTCDAAAASNRCLCSGFGD